VKALANIMRFTSNKAGLCAVILLTLCSIAGAEVGTFRPVQLSRVPEVLTMIADQVRSNYERIRTWEGQVNVKRHAIYDGPDAEHVFKMYTNEKGEPPQMIVESSESRIQFRTDLKAGLFYSKNDRQKPPQYTDFETGKDLGTKLDAGYRVSIVTGECYLHSSSNIIREGSSTRRIAFKEEPPKECLPCELPSVFDPRTLFEIPEPVWKTFPQILQYISKYGKYAVGGHALKVEERIEANLIEYRVRIPAKSSDGNLILTTKTFSGAKGYNVTLAEVTDVEGRLLKRAALDYTLIEGALLPNKTVSEHFGGKNGQRNYEKTAYLENMRINRSIPHETFTYKNLGLRNGDKLIDSILGKQYIYQNELLIPEGTPKQSL